MLPSRLRTGPLQLITDEVMPIRARLSKGVLLSACLLAISARLHHTEWKLGTDSSVDHTSVYCHPDSVILPISSIRTCIVIIGGATKTE
jgi:hypothetical protein